MRIISFITLFFVLIGSLSAQSYHGDAGKAIKGATVNVGAMALDTITDYSNFSGIKTPNKNWKAPDFKTNPDRIIYQEAPLSQRANKPVSREMSPAPTRDFLSLEDNQRSIPPDVMGAAGPNHLMTTLNTEVRIQDKEGNVLMTTSLGNFWKPLPGTSGTFDPKILYDPYNDRWIMTTPSGSNVSESKLYIGVSTSSDPMGDWNFYWVDTDASNIAWFDYPSIGFNKKWITVSGNMFGGDYYRTVFVFDKMAAYNGDEDINFTRFTTYEGFTLVPSVTYDNETEDQYLIATGDGDQNGYGYIKKFKLSGELNNPVFEYQGDIGIPEPWSGWGGDFGNFLPQLGSSQLINSVDARMETVIYRNNKLWAVHHVFLPAGDPQRCAVQWWELDTDGVILEHGRIEDQSNTFSFAFPSIAVNANEDVMIGHNVFSSTQYAGAGYSFKAYYDEPNSMRTYYQYKEGEAPYYKTYGGDRNRWGDYSATCVDPENDIDFWALQEFAMIPQGGDTWGTWWAMVKPSFSPVADFTSDETLIPTGESINFTDLTIGVPSEWQWEFEGGVPAVSSEQNPQNIVYPNEGTFTVTLTVSNLLGTDVVTKQQFITVSSSILPEISFSVDIEKVCVNQSVSFTDFTLYSPIQWEWQFDPSTVTFVNGTDQYSQNPEVEFNEANVYAVTLTATNLNGSSTLTEFDLISAGGYQPWFAEDFEYNGFDRNNWEIENPDNSKTWEIFSIGGNNPGHMAAGVNFRDYPAIGKRDRLISPPFNLEGMTNAYLEFQHAYTQNTAVPATDSLIVYLSADCGETWTRLRAMGEDGSGNFATHEPTADLFFPQVASDWCGDGWGSECNVIDLGAWLGMSNIKIAFETYSFYGNALLIDNVSISQTVGIEQKPVISEVQIFPNPSNGIIHVLVPEKSGIHQVELLNQMGTKLISKPVGGPGEILLNESSQYAPGIYLIKTSGTGKSFTHKIIIVR
ncbi:MAG: PKD domain-containing protein [Bacteroidales bacterium]|nr:PKD domain-containing protein [Bacteroidales bacterium]